MPGFIRTEFNNPDGFIKKINFLQMSPEKAARKIVNAIRNKKREIILTNHGKILICLERYTPSLLRTLSKIFINIRK